MSFFRTSNKTRQSFEFEESKHPRDGGKFAPKEGSGGEDTSAAEPAAEPKKSEPPNGKEIVGALTKAKWGRFGTSKPPTANPADAVPDGLSPREIEVLGFMAQRNGLGQGAKDYPKGKKAKAAHIQYWRDVIVELIKARDANK